MKKVVVAAWGVSLAGLVAITVVYSSRSSVVAKGPAGVHAAAHDPVSERGAELEISSAMPALDPQTSARPDPSGVHDPALRARLRRAAEVRRRIAEIRRNETPPSRAAEGKPTMPAAEGDGNQVGKPLGEYVGNVLKAQFNPVAKSCYEELLSRRPAAKGKLILNVTVVGDSRSVG